MTWQTEDEATEDTIDEALANPRFVHPAVLARMIADDESGTAEDRYLRERAEQEIAAPHYSTDCVVCGVALFVATSPERNDHTCESCRRGWRT